MSLLIVFPGLLTNNDDMSSTTLWMIWLWLWTCLGIGSLYSKVQIEKCDQHAGGGTLQGVQGWDPVHKGSRARSLYMADLWPGYYTGIRQTKCLWTNRITDRQTRLKTLPSITSFAGVNYASHHTKICHYVLVSFFYEFCFIIFSLLSEVLSFQPKRFEKIDWSFQRNWWLNWTVIFIYHTGRTDWKLSYETWNTVSSNTF